MPVGEVYPGKPKENKPVVELARHLMELAAYHKKKKAVVPAPKPAPVVKKQEKPVNPAPVKTEEKK